MSITAAKRSFSIFICRKTGMYVFLLTNRVYSKITIIYYTNKFSGALFRKTVVQLTNINRICSCIKPSAELNKLVYFLDSRELCEGEMRRPGLRHGETSVASTSCMSGRRGTNAAVDTRCSTPPLKNAATISLFNWLTYVSTTR